MRISRAAAVACAGLLAAALTACTTSPPAASTASGASTGAGGEAAAATPAAGSVSEALAANVATHAEADDAAYDAASAVPITLDGSSAAAGGSGVSIAGSRVTVTAPGTYLVSGTLGDGQLLVNSPGEGTVRIVLDDASTTSSTSAPFVVLAADEVVVVLAEGSSNTLADAQTYTYPAGADEPNAALFSAADLTIAGSGALTVTGNANDAIASKDGLVIASGTITVRAKDDGIRGKDYVIVDGGEVTVTAGGDGVKADNAEEADRGYVALLGGTLEVTSGGDGSTQPPMPSSGPAHSRSMRAEARAHRSPRTPPPRGSRAR